MIPKVFKPLKFECILYISDSKQTPQEVIKEKLLEEKMMALKLEDQVL